MTDKTEETNQTTEVTSKPEPLKNRWHANFYLTDGFKQELLITRQRVDISFVEEYGVELGTNRHFRPLILWLGIQQVQDMDATEIARVLETTDVLDSPGVEIDEWVWADDS
jgi:hypothetical protein